MQALANDDQDDYKRHAIPPLAVGVFTVERHVLVEAACGKFQARVTELLGHDVLHADEASVAMLRLGQGNGRALKSH